MRKTTSQFVWALMATAIVAVKPVTAVAQSGGTGEAISRAFTVDNQLPPPPPPVDAISRAFTVLNQGPSLFTPSEAISRAFTVDNLLPEPPEQKDAISRAFTVLNVGSPMCGDGAVINPEECDDADAVNGDGCSSSCVVEDQFVCTGEPSICLSDCNRNEIADETDVVNCDGSAWCADCNGNETLDDCDIATCTGGPSCADCNSNGVPDECDIADCSGGTACNDCNGDGVPDGCQPDADCNYNTVRDLCDIGSGFSLDCNRNLVPDDCDIADDPSLDGDLNGVPDICELCGDIDDDLDADGDDFAVLLAAFGRSVGDPRYNAAADLDGDGTVTLVDYQLWLACYRQSIGNATAAAPDPGLPGDFDADRDIDLADFSDFTMCLNGRPEFQFPCVMKFDLDRNRRVELDDYAYLWGVMQEPRR